MISIIVPVYNTEKYLRECIESLLAQTFTDIEILLVDDGSTDNSLAICMEYEKRDRRIKIIHKENSGVSDTRNMGIEHANGDYISFCDSDDKVVPELYQMLFDTMNKYQVDRVVSGYAYLYGDGRTLYKKPRLPDGKYEANIILKKMIDDGTLSGFLFSGVYNSLFKKKIIDENNIRFNSLIRYNEDSLFSLNYMLYSNTIYSLQSIPTYFYRQHNSSATNKKIVGDKYENLRHILMKMGLEKRNINFEMQMENRFVTEAFWHILEIAKFENKYDAVPLIKHIVYDKKLRKYLKKINIKELNIYKKFYYMLILGKMPRLIYYSSSKFLPFFSKYLSR